MNRIQKGLFYGLRHIFEYIFERFLIIRLPFLLYEIADILIKIKLFVKGDLHWDSPSLPHYKDLIYNYKNGKFDSEKLQVDLRRYNLRFTEVKNYDKIKFLIDFQNRDLTNYSRNELIVNFFWHILNSGVSPAGYLSLNFIQIIKLSCMPEFRGKSTNNHIINSYRGALFFGLITGNKFLFNYGIAGLNKWFNTLANKYSFDEGSTHYSLIFNIWVMDIYLVLMGTGLSGIDLGKYCKEYLITNIKNLELIIDSSAPITIGDLSPDISFDFARMMNRRIRDWLLESKLTSCTSNLKNKIVTINNNEYEHFICYYDKSNCNKIGYSSHHHNDDLSFVLADRERCYLFDPGRFCYSNTNPLSRFQMSHLGHSNVIVKEGSKEIQISMIESFKNTMSSKILYQDKDRNISLNRSISLTNFGCEVYDLYEFTIFSTWALEYKFMLNKKFTRIIFDYDKLTTCVEKVDAKNHILSFDYGVLSDCIINNTSTFTSYSNQMRIITKIHLD
jgi:hypothetical protein